MTVLKNVIHFGRIIIYGILFAITVSLYGFLHSHLLLMIMTLMAAAPVLSVLLAFYLRNKLSVRILAPESDVLRHSVSYVSLVVQNPSYIMSLDVKLKLHVQNLFYHTENSILVSLPTRMHGDSETMLPMRLTMNGAVQYTVEDLRVLDLLGFVELKKKVNLSAEVNVLPERIRKEQGSLSDFSGGFTEMEENNKRGNDFSDVNDVREYIPGDRLMSIHWKLSAKRDILMVKDRVSMSDQQMVILTELAGSIEEVDDTISLTYHLCRSLIEEKIFVRLLWWSEGRSEFADNRLFSIDDLKDAFSRMYYDTIYADPEKTVAYMRSIKPELKAYVHVCQKEGKADAVIVEQE